MRRALLLASTFLACDRPPSPSPPTTASEAPPAPADREVVADGACWVLGAEPEIGVYSDTRWVYERGRLQRVERFEPDRTTLKATEMFERDANGHVTVRASAWADPPEEISRSQTTWDQTGRRRSGSWSLGGEPAGTFELTYDAAGHRIGLTRRRTNGELDNTTWRWVATDEGGWTVTQTSHYERPATRDRAAEVVDYPDNETVILDRRGRPIEERGGAVCRHFLWDGEDRCIQATIFDACTPRSHTPQYVRVTIRREFGDSPRASTTTYDRQGKIATVRHVVDDAGNVIEIQRTNGHNTRFEYEGEFRNALCHDIDASLREGAEWPSCGISER